MKLKTMLWQAMASVLAILLAGCQLTGANRIDFTDCKPSPPSLEWYEVDGGGVYYPPRSVVNLELYLEDLNRCIDYHQANPG